MHRVLQHVRGFLLLNTNISLRICAATSYNGRPELLMLPPKEVQQAPLEFNQHQRMVYDVLFKHAKSRYERLKRQELAVARVIQVMQMLAPVRQAASGGEVTVVDAIARMEAEVRHDDTDEATRKNKEAVLELKLDQIAVATQESLSKLDDECVICLEILEEPLQTPCLHLFCADCIKGVLANLPVNARACPLW